MGWFDEQIRERKEADRQAFEDSFMQIAGAVMGRRMSQALDDDRTVTTDAVGEVLKYYHVKAKEVPESIRDMNEVLEYLMRPYGIMKRSVRLEDGWYKDAIGAMLGTRKDDGSVVALIPFGLSGYRFFDRKTGSYVRINKKTQDLIDGEAFAFYLPFPLKKLTTADFVKYLTGLVRASDMVMLLIAMAAATLTVMILPKLNAILFSDVLMSGSTGVLLAMSVFMICVTLSSMIFEVVKGFAAARLNARLDLSVEAASMMRVLSLPAAFFKDYNTGDLANRVGYLNSLTEQFVGIALTTGLSSIFSLAYISQILLFSPSLVAPAMTVTILTALLTIVTMLIQVKISKRQMELASKESGISHALIGGIQKIRLAGAEKRAFARWGKSYAEAASLLYNPPMLLKVSTVIGSAISLVGTLVIYSVAVKNRISVSDYYAFNTAYGMVSGAFLALAGIATSLAQIKPVMEMAKPLLETVPEIDENKAVVTSLSGGVELSNVSFRYKEDMPLILDNLSLKIRAGQYVAIVGRTGCGKSTLMRLLLGFEKPQKGSIYYDGKDLASLDPKSLRRRIGSVMQDGKVFMGDIFSNITISAPWLTMDDAWEAAEISGLADDIRAMPMGMHTMISEGQGGISGGQRQRLMIARAVAPKPKILMFDEATSALDNLTQKKVSDALDAMKCTRLVIAHRLSTIRQCDRIIVLDQGRIIEDGSFDELIEKNGYFAELVARQRLDDTQHEGKTTAF